MTTRSAACGSASTRVGTAVVLLPLPTGNPAWTRRFNERTNGTANVTEYPAHLQSKRLRVTSYDRAWCWLLSLLLLIGGTVFILFMIWLSNRIHVVDIARDVDLTEIGDGEGGGDGRPPGGTQLESQENSAEPVPVDTSMPDMQDAVAAVTETVVEQVAMLDDPALQPPKAKGDYGTGGGSGGGSGPGRGLGHGPGRPGRPQRWQLRFSKVSTIETYARQLDDLEIELGIIAPSKDKVIYLSHFTGGIPNKHEGPMTDKRYHFNWQKGDLREADFEFFRRARVNIENNDVIFMFIQPKWEQELLRLEKEKNGKPISEIKWTRFGIISEGGKFKFNVIEQMLK